MHLQTASKVSRTFLGVMQPPPPPSHPPPPPHPPSCSPPLLSPRIDIGRHHSSAGREAEWTSGPSTVVVEAHRSQPAASGPAPAGLPGGVSHGPRLFCLSLVRGRVVSLGKPMCCLWTAYQWFAASHRSNRLTGNQFESGQTG